MEIAAGRNVFIPKVHKENMVEVEEETYLEEINGKDDQNTRNVRSRVAKGSMV